MSRNLQRGLRFFYLHDIIYLQNIKIISFRLRGLQTGLETNWRTSDVSKGLPCPSEWQASQWIWHIRDLSDHLLAYWILWWTSFLSIIVSLPKTFLYCFRHVFKKTSKEEKGPHKATSEGVVWWKLLKELFEGVKELFDGKISAPKQIKRDWRKFWFSNTAAMNNQDIIKSRSGRNQFNKQCRTSRQPQRLHQLLLQKILLVHPRQDSTIVMKFVTSWSFKRLKNYRRKLWSGPFCK